MATNPLQKYFRQPKIYINLPSKGIYNVPGSIQGDASRIPIFGMTGMDEILLKTPDALLTGESTVKVIESCCPAITDGWETNNLDLEILLAAIRIATYGNILSMTRACSNCGAENDYDLDLSTVIDHYATCSYDNEIVFDDFKVYIRPLTYRVSSDFAQQNFNLQRQLGQVDAMTDQEERKQKTNELFDKMATLQTEIYCAGIESVHAGGSIVTERSWIKEWLENSEKDVFIRIRDHIIKNQNAWETPAYKVICKDCSHEDTVTVFLDQSNFFGRA
jgi:hypothetical protein